MADQVALPESTMFSKTPVYAEDGVLQFGLRVPDVAGNGDRICRVSGPLSDRIDLASAIYQGNPQLWWVMADLTGLVDPFTEVTTGTDLRFRPTANK
jgi:hypothetical protein